MSEEDEKVAVAVLAERVKVIEGRLDKIIGGLEKILWAVLSGVGVTLFHAVMTYLEMRK